MSEHVRQHVDVDVDVDVRARAAVDVDAPACGHARVDARADGLLLCACVGAAEEEDSAVVRGEERVAGRREGNTWN